MTVGFFYYMGMIERAQAAVKKYRSDPNGFTKRMTFTREDGSKSVVVYGMHSKIHMTTTTIGETINGKRPHVSVSESSLTDLGYPTRNSNNEVSMINDRIMVVDSSGQNCQYVITQTFPDETLGLIVCILGDSE